MLLINKQPNLMCEKLKFESSNRHFHLRGSDVFLKNNNISEVTKQNHKNTDLGDAV